MSTLSVPNYAVPFVGRNAEFNQIASLLADDMCRLLSLVGPGGIGKTRLAAESARRQFKQFRDGAFFVSLQALNTSEFVVSTVAEALDFQFSPNKLPRQQLVDYLSNKSCLLVLDNFEHLLDASALIVDILYAAPGVKFLITSRERVNLLEEWVLEISGLPFPTNTSESEIAHYDAVQLFVQHAQRVYGGFALTDKRKPAVARICRLVGGMPLGIELAAAWVRVLPCEDIAREIERSLDILQSAARNVEPRHRNVRAAFEPTWKRLSQDERDVFIKLSVFRGGFTREAAEQVTGASLQLLVSLADKSLLRINANERYDLHELLRQFGDEQLTLLTDTSELENLQKCHADYYMALAETPDPPSRATQQGGWDRLEIENANFRAALAWCRTAAVGRTIGLRLALALVGFWQFAVT